MFRFGLLLYFILGSYFFADAQAPYRFLHFNAGDGLSQNSVHSIFQDKDGLMWIGTQDGLNSFNGKDFTVYRHDDNDTTTISDQFVLNIQEDSKGYLWVGTRNGLNRFNKHTGKFTRYYVRAGERHTFQAAYSNFTIQKDGKVVIVGPKPAIIDPETKQVQQLNLPGRRWIWHVTDNYEAYILTDSLQQYFCSDIRKGDLHLLATDPLHWDKQAVLPACTGADGMIYYFRRDKQTVVPFNYREKKWFAPITLPDRINQLRIVSEKEAYAATANGVYKITGNITATLIKSKEGDESSLSPGSILCTYVDREGNLWTGTAGNGFAVSSPAFNNYILLKPPVRNDIVSCIFKRGNTVYFGTRSGLYRTEKAADGSSFSTPIPLLPGKKVTALTAGQNGLLWIGIDDGIWVMDTKGKIIKKFSPQNSSFEGGIVIQLYTDSRNRVLACCENNLYAIPSLTGQWIKFANTGTKDKISGNYVMSAFEDKDHNTWICHNMGIDIFDPGFNRIRSFISENDTSSPIRRTIVTNCTQDKDGAMWISTIRNGVYRYSNDSFTHYTTAAGLSSEVVYNVVCDEKNRVWAMTSAGLDIFDKDQQHFSAITPLDGVPATGFVLNAVFRDTGGHLLFGSSDGLLDCNTANIILHKTTVAAAISDIKVNGQSIGLSSGSLTLVPDNKVISVTFSSSPEFFYGNIIYQYRLKGAATEWTTLPNGIHSISYNGLPYGEFDLEVRAATSVNNLQNASIATLHLKSKEPFHKTTAFLGLCIITIIGLAALGVTAYNRHRSRKQLEALKMEKQLRSERERIGRDLHDNIGAYTSALIAGLNQVRPADATQEKHVDNLKEYAVNIMSFLRETIWMLNTQTLSVTAFADRFKNYALRIGKNYPEVELQVKENIQDDKILAPATMLNIFRILQEALQNAYKHSQAKTIQVSFNSNGELHFEVSDSGSGFTEEQQAEQYGLANMRQRAAEAGFILSIESRPGKGTIVSIKENTAYAAAATFDQNSNL